MLVVPKHLLREPVLYHRNAEHQAEAKRLAAQRQAFNMGRRDLAFARKDRSQANHEIGFEGEIAVRTIYGGKLNAENVQGNDGGVDVRMAGGLTVQVKTTTARWHRFFMPTLDRTAFTAHIGIIVVPESDAVLWLKGWMTREEFVRRAEPEDIGHGLHLCYQDRDLRPMRLLSGWMAARAMAV